jgi:histidinol-phosphate aminotransferase/threonine-phosphate decarboxylase
MDSEAVARLAGEGRVPHGSSDDPDVLDFSANTNPRTPAGVADAYADALTDAHSYPDDAYPRFRERAATHVDTPADDSVDPSQVVPTPGGLAALRLVLGTAVDPGDSVLVPQPSFGEYAREVRLQGGDPVFVAHDAVLDRDPEPYAAVVVCNPNNPTGDALDPERLRDYAGRCHHAGTLLLADEAFLGFTEHPSLAGHPGTVVARSLTKLFGLPGLRAGFAVAAGEHRDRLAAARRTWNLGAPAAAVGAHCMADRAFVAETRERVARERERMADRLAAAFDIHESVAPFLLLDAGTSERVDRLLRAAEAEGIALRDARTFRGLDSHVRVAVRLPDENDRLLAVLTDE